MNRRFSASLVVWLGLWLWPVNGTAADSMSGGGVSSSGSQPWIGGHNNMPRQTLSPVGTVFTPPTSFGNYWILNNAASQTVACPPDIADGDGMNVHIQYGAGAPYSPAVLFSSPCYGWTNGTQPSWSENATQSDSVFCQSMNPADVSGASFVCAPQLNVKPIALIPAIVQTLKAAGPGAGATAQSVTLTGFASGHTALFVASWCGLAGCSGNGSETITSAAATGGTCTQITNSFTGVATPQPVYMYRCTGMSAGSVTFTANWSANAFFPNAIAVELANDNGAEAGAAATGSSTAPAVTSGVLSQASNELVIAYGYPLQTITAVNSPFTLIGLSGGDALGWYLVPTCSSCTEAATFTQNLSSQWSAVVAGFKHP